MPWDESGNDAGQIKWTETTNHLNVSVAPVSRQFGDSDSLLRYFRRLIRLRNKFHYLVSVSTKAVQVGSDKVVVFVRTNDESSSLIIHNLSGDSQQVRLPREVRDHKKTLYTFLR